MASATPPPPTNGEERQWVKCKTCGRVAYYDYLPDSLSNPLLSMPCGHDVGSHVRDVAVTITQAEAHAALGIEDEPAAPPAECAHLPDPDSVEVATGYDPEAEAGVVLTFKCLHCKCVGNALLAGTAEGCKVIWDDEDDEDDEADEGGGQEDGHL